jgi:hypothetical protein
LQNCLNIREIEETREAGEARFLECADHGRALDFLTFTIQGIPSGVALAIAFQN